MSASISNATPPIVASQSTAAANTPSPGPSATVAAGPAPPTARSSYASATKKISSPPIASSAAPPVAVGGPNTHHGKSAPISPPDGGNPIKPAVPAMSPTIVNSGAAHGRQPSVTISAAGTTGFIPNGGPVTSSRAPSNLTFGFLAGSPGPSHAALHHPQGSALNPQAQNPRVTSPAHSPSPIPTPTIASGGKPDTLPTRPNLVFGGGSDGAEPNNRPVSLSTQPNSLPQAQHLRHESSQSAHSDLNAQNMNKSFPPNGGNRGGRAYNNYPQMTHSPTSFRAMPSQQPRGSGMAPVFQPQAGMQGNSPFRSHRSPAIAPAAMHQQAYMANPQMPYPGPYPQQNLYGAPPPNLDAYSGYYGQNFSGHQYGMQPSMHFPGGVPPSPGQGHSFPHQGPYPMPGSYGQPPQATGMSRTPSNMSERPPSAVAQPSTPAMTNVNASHAHTLSASSSPAPNASKFAIPAKTQKVVVKTPEGTVVDLKAKKAPSPAAAAVPQPKTPAIVATPTPPPRPESAHSRSESVATKSKEEKQADFVKQFKANLEAEQRAKDEAEAKVKEEEVEAQRKKEAAEAEAKAAKEKKEKDEKEAAGSLEKEKEAAEKKRLADEEMERMIAEMEAAEKEEEERERAFAAQKKADAEEKKKHEAKEEEERLKAAEREADEAETARIAQETPEQKAEREMLFAGLKKNSMFGPSATANASGDSTPPAEPTVVPPVQLKTVMKPKPAALKIETIKSVEPAQPTAGMQSLKSARFLQVRNETVNYPEGFRSPNPALNIGSKGKGRPYDMSFLLQFRDVFQEKPSLDWDSTLKETVGDSSDSARPPSARTPSIGMGGRQPSRTGGLGAGPMGNFQGNFGGARTLPPGTTSEQRFQQASNRGPMTNPLAQLVAPAGRPGGFPVQMARSSSFQNMTHAAPNSPRVSSSRGRGSRRGGDRGGTAKEEKSMPLTAGQEVKSLERSNTGWAPPSRTQTSTQPAAGHMAPDMVQRKVKAALNKMTPEKFDKISDQILQIASQSKDEQDGRTLRQVIQLTFEKACDEQHWSSMYAKFCAAMLNTMSTDIKDENVRNKNGEPVVGGALFRKYLLNRCQEEFEKGWEVNLPEKPEGEGEAALLSDEYYIAAAAKRRGLGLIQFIGELYKLNMLTMRIMHECVLKLLNFEGLPDESAVESLTKLLRTVGQTMSESEAGPKMLSVYFGRIEKVMNMEGIPSRQKFMLLDLIDLKRAGWREKGGLKGPKTLAEIHQEAAAAQQAAEMERTRTSQRSGPRAHMGRGDARSFSGGGALPPQDFPTSRVQIDDLRKLSKGTSGRNLSNAPTLGPSMLGNRSNSGRRGLGPGGSLMGRGDDSGASSRTGTPVQKEKEPTAHANAFSPLMNLDNEGAGEVGSTPSTASASEAKNPKPAE